MSKGVTTCAEILTARSEQAEDGVQGEPGLRSAQITLDTLAVNNVEYVIIMEYFLIQNTAIGTFS